MRLSFCSVVFVLIILVMPSVTSAQITWNFNSSTASSGTVSNLTVGAITQVNNNGSTTLINNGTPASSGYSGASGGNNGNFSAKTGSVNTGTSTYAQIVLTPASNYSVRLTGLTWGNYSVSTSGPSTVAIYTSADNYAAPVATASVLQNSSWALLSPVFNAVAANKGTALTVRIYAYGGTGSSPSAGTANWRIDDLKLSVKALPVTETIFMSMKYASSPNAPSPWNDITGLITNNLNNSAGTMTSVGLDFLSGNWNNTGNAGRQTGNNSGVYPDAVMKDYYWCGAYGAPDTMVSNIKGLDTAARYNIILFGSSVWNGVSNNGTTMYSLNGVAKSLYVDSNYLNTVSFNDVKPNNAGIIQFKFYKGTFAPYALLNTIVLEKLYDSLVVHDSWNYGGNTVGSVQKLGTVDSTDLPIITNNVERMILKANGKMGIGTSSPDSALHIVGGLKISNGTQGAGKVLTSDANGGASWQNIPAGNAADSAVFVTRYRTDTALANVRAQLGSNWKLSGNTGINPRTQFLGSADTNLIMKSFGVTKLKFDKFKTSSSADTVVFNSRGMYAMVSSRIYESNRTTTSGGGTAGYLTVFGHDLSADPDEYDAIQVGDGTTVGGLLIPGSSLLFAVTAEPSIITSDTVHLQVGTNVSTAAHWLALDFSGGMGDQFKYLVRVRDLFTGNSTPDSLKLSGDTLWYPFTITSNSASRGYRFQIILTAVPNVAVGINTDKPEAALHVLGDFKLEDGNQGAGKVLTSDASGKATWQNSNTGNARWTGSGVNTYHSEISGSVFIGMTSLADTNYRLYVEKGIRSRKVKVDIHAWPDYVFKPDYELRSIPDVEKYIKENGHLPELPAASEIEKEGLNLGDNQAALLKKIEELTLYIIDLNKKVTALEEQNNRLQKAIDKK